MKLLTRRQLMHEGVGWLSSAGAIAALGQLGQVYAKADTASGGYKALVCVFLFGGNDANNMVIPILGQAAQTYKSVRGSFGISNPVGLTGTSFGLHPNLSGLANVFNTQNNLAVTCNVGTLLAPMTRTQYLDNSVRKPINLFSHEDQQQEWQLCDALERLTTGWGGRSMDLFESNPPPSFPLAVSVAGSNTFLVGLETQPTCIGTTSFTLPGEDGTAATAARDASLAQALALSNGAVLVQAANTTIQNAIALTKQINSVPALPATLSFPNTSLGNQLKQIAQIIAARNNFGVSRQVFFASLGGFDTHTSQLATQASLYQQLNDAMIAFNTAMADSSIAAADNVTVFTQSEFARTFQPNTNGGTDHAWGSHHMVMGAAVKGGMYGQFPDLALQGDSDCGYRGCWIPTTSLDQYAATLASWFGVTNLSSVFQNLSTFGNSTLGFL